MNQNWSPSQDQNQFADYRQPAPCCNECHDKAAAGMGNVGFEIPTFEWPQFDQNTLLIGGGLLLSAIIAMQIFGGGRRDRAGGNAQAKARYISDIAARTGRIPRF